MVDLNKFEHFVKETFTKIRDDSIRSLIIDVRKNGGGNSRLIDVLFPYFTRKPYTQSVRMEWKTSLEMRSFYKKKYMKWYLYPLYPLLYFHPMGKAVLFRKPGTINVFEFEPEKPPQVEPFFTGKVYLLTGLNTFSSANILAIVFKCYKLGLVIGQETGGVTVAYGEVIPYVLPNTGLQGGCSSKRFVHPCGKEDGHGVIPDIEVRQSVKDLKMGVDTVLEFTVNYIKQSEFSKLND